MGCNLSILPIEEDINSRYLPIINDTMINYNSDIILSEFNLKLLLRESGRRNNLNPLNLPLEYVEYSTSNIQSNNQLKIESLKRPYEESISVFIGKKWNTDILSITALNKIYDIQQIKKRYEIKFKIEEMGIIFLTSGHEVGKIKNRYHDLIDNDLVASTNLRGLFIPWIILYVLGYYYITSLAPFYSRAQSLFRLIGNRKSMKNEIEPIGLGSILSIGGFVCFLVTYTNINGVKRYLTKNDIKENIYYHELEHLFPEENDLLSYQTKKREKHHVCYFCYKNEENINNPLVSLCKCKGDTGWVHINCLRIFLNIDVKRINNKIDIIQKIYTGHKCKICNTYYKTHINTENGCISIFDKINHQEDSISILMISKQENNEESFLTKYNISLVNMENKINYPSISVGRSPNCDISLPYRSISQNHASIFLKKDQLYIKDLKSYNGTFIFQERPYILKPNKSPKFQVGVNEISIDLENSFSFFAKKKRKRLDTAESVQESINEKESNNEKESENISLSCEEDIDTILNELREELS